MPSYLMVEGTVALALLTAIIFNIDRIFGVMDWVF